MPPVTRHQLKKTGLKTEPYSKENRPLDRRAALLDLVSNNGAKTSNKLEIVKDDNSTKTDKTCKVTQQKIEITQPAIIKKPETRSSIKETERLSLNSSEDSNLFKSTLEETVASRNSAKSDELYITAVDNTHSSSLEINHSELYHSAALELSVNSNEEEIFEIDQASWNNFIYVGCYARDIMKYLRQREDHFIITDYINKQPEITAKHRAIVVNWLVSLQEMYGLNHEVLYMAVKLIDLYLMENETLQNKFQLLASGALLLATKIDERGEPGFPYDLVKHSKYIYTEEELFLTERELFRALKYDINVPLSYVFLRRYARCMKCQMILLTLARYILECSLLEYKFVILKDSLKAAASLYLAFKMCNKEIETKEFFKYTDYEVTAINETVIELNNMLHTQSSNLSAVKRKYSHETFFKVANKSLLSNSKLTFD
ncbi:G2/mitotic-specific cyclin-B3 [Melanaphis sacchari]|uniref:G2/mitotic-specific cyclin-B3 n=1 Tax=Melanaphis sacchari TaxID=742174 RepID=A0A2H8TL35_9HEMI|nr:G2/mitotic-specific cyclin-B3 [Melanaphis sacchari]XP_025198113.1 G2/mitotic-specific cyclin-B3 [Melanaphis sacchari]